MKESGEGTGTITNFYMEDLWGNRVTPIAEVKQGKGAYYTEAYSNASETRVWLMAKNNNFSLASYYVSGYWDEETW